jgi:hypothetical protein
VSLRVTLSNIEDDTVVRMAYDPRGERDVGGGQGRGGGGGGGREGGYEGLPFRGRGRRKLNLWLL